MPEKKLSEIKEFERDYRGLLSGVLGALRGYKIASVVSRSRLTDEEWKERGRMLIWMRPQILDALKKFRHVQAKMTWTPTSHIRRRERHVAALVSELHVERWNCPRD